MKQVTAKFDLNSINEIPPFSLAKKEKDALYVDVLYKLTKHHYENCSPYRKILDVLGFDPTIRCDIEDIPPIPVRLFKDYDLMSAHKSQIIKNSYHSHPYRYASQLLDNHGILFVFTTIGIKAKSTSNLQQNEIRNILQ